MPRPLRINNKNAWYHVMNRGARRFKIFETTGHRIFFLKLIQEATELFQIECHTFCLMDNHYHLLIKTPNANLSEAMQHINGKYSQYYNYTEKIDGPLFRGRYKAILIQSETYLLNVSRYIHLNPVAAGIVLSPENYLWSSYKGYSTPNLVCDWLYTKAILSMLDECDQYNEYEKFVAQGLDIETEKFYQRKKLPSILGTNDYINSTLEKLPADIIQKSQVDYNRTYITACMLSIDLACAKLFHVDVNNLYISKRGQHQPVRTIAIYCARYWAKAKVIEIAARYGFRNNTSVSISIKRFIDKLQQDTILQRQLDLVREEIDKMQGRKGCGPDKIYHDRT